MKNKPEDEEEKNLLHERRHHKQSRLELAETSITQYVHLLFWWWIYPVLLQSSKNNLTENDIDETPCSDQSSLLAERLQVYNWSSTNSFHIIIQEFWKEYLIVNLPLILFPIARLAQQWFYRQVLLDMIEKQKVNTNTYFSLTLLFICIAGQTLVYRLIVFQSTRVGVRIRNGIITMVCKHVLTLKSSTWRKVSTGQIINLIASDVGKFEELAKNFACLCQAILETIAIFVILYCIIGLLPAFFTFGVFFIFIPIQLYLSKIFRQCSKMTAELKEKRLETFSEFLHAYHAIKMYNWEKLFLDRITQRRQLELNNIRYASRHRALNMTQFFISSPLFAMTAFSVAWLFDYPLNLVDTFVALSLFALLRSNIMFFLPCTTEKISETITASKRIDIFMRLATLDQLNQSSPSTYLDEHPLKGKIIFSDASFSWSDEQWNLSIPHLIIEPYEFLGVVGPVGAGKSSLLAALLGEMELVDGQMNSSDSSFSYAAQVPWLFTETIRNNIILDQYFDSKRYNNVLYACCLDVDLPLIGPSGDHTIVGEKGVNLSGGQKVRISLARALYRDADVYLLDDPFSAVDNTVGKQLYDRCIGPYGLLRSKTRILVTHRIEYLKHADRILHLVDGRIDKQTLSNDDVNKQTMSNDDDQSTSSEEFIDPTISIVDENPVVADEDTIKGKGKWSLWYRLFSAPPLGIFGFLSLIILLVLGEIFNDLSTYWLSLRTKASAENENLAWEFPYIYIILILLTIVTDVTRTNYFFMILLNGAEELHRGMLTGLLYTRSQFFESNPIGRIISRPSRDQQILDESLPFILFEGIRALLLTAGSLIIICFTNIYLLILIVLLLPIIYLLMHFYLKSSQQLKRIECGTCSSVYASVSSTFHGLMTIRAYKAENYFIQSIFKRIDINTSAVIYAMAAPNWFAIQLTIACWLIYVFVCLRIVLFPNEISPAGVALSLMSTMYFIAWFQLGVRQICDAGLMITSAERLEEYSKLPTEEDKGGNNGLVMTSSKWPAHGTMEFRNYSMQHRSNCPYALQNISFRIEAGNKVGIIGRTGAGKSSLFKGIFRFVNRSCVAGDILIDHVSIHRITLNQLRSKLSIIPQQPFLLKETLRYNLDPLNQHTDEECWLALEDVQLRTFVKDHPHGLSMQLTESGTNLSVGQAHLICIARALLKKCKILLIDEATANVNKEMDAIIQRVIADKFHDRTVLTIAHRLDSIRNYDHILLLDGGKLIKYDTVDHFDAFQS